MEVEDLDKDVDEIRAWAEKIKAMLAQMRARREAHWAKMEKTRIETMLIRTKVANILIRVTFNEELLEDVAQGTNDHEDRLLRIEDLLGIRKLQ